MKPVSVDVGLLERTANVLVIPGDFGWDDIGTWGALLRSAEPDKAGNVSHGDTHLVDAKRNVVHAEDGTVVLYGVNDLVVVSRKGVTMVTTTERANDLKALLDELPAGVRDRS